MSRFVMITTEANIVGWWDREWEAMRALKAEVDHDPTAEDDLMIAEFSERGLIRRVFPDPEPKRFDTYAAWRKLALAHVVR